MGCLGCRVGGGFEGLRVWGLKFQEKSFKPRSAFALELIRICVALWDNVGSRLRPPPVGTCCVFWKERPLLSLWSSNVYSPAGGRLVAHGNSVRLLLPSCDRQTEGQTEGQTCPMHDFGGYAPRGKRFRAEETARQRAEGQSCKDGPVACKLCLCKVPAAEALVPVEFYSWDAIYCAGLESANSHVFQ